MTKGARQLVTVSQHGHNTAMPARGTQPRYSARARYDTVSQATTWLARAYDTALGAATTRPREHTWAHLGVLAGSGGCAHYALVQFLDSVLFLSHCSWTLFMNTVHRDKKKLNSVI